MLPNTTYLVTRRCSERRFFLRPSQRTNDIFLYVLALAARRYGVLVHAYCVLSNHCHLVLSDPAGRLPAFMQYLDSLVARAVNASLGRFEGFWAVDASYSAVEPIDPGDVVAKTAYVLANPVAAGLVARGAEWPGLWTSPDQLGAARLVARKPQIFFDPKGYLPDLVELELTSPPRAGPAADFRRLVAAELAALESKHQREIAAARKRFVGAAKMLAQSPFASPRVGEPRFELNPRVAARDKWRRIEAINRLKSFLREYRTAWLARRSGVTGVLFPSGTYLLRILHGVQCAGGA